MVVVIVMSLEATTLVEEATTLVEEATRQEEEEAMVVHQQAPESAMQTSAESATEETGADSHMREVEEEEEVTVREDSITVEEEGSEEEPQEEEVDVSVTHSRRESATVERDADSLTSKLFTYSYSTEPEHRALVVDVKSLLKYKLGA